MSTSRWRRLASRAWAPWVAGLVLTWLVFAPRLLRGLHRLRLHPLRFDDDGGVELYALLHRTGEDPFRLYGELLLLLGLVVLSARRGRARLGVRLAWLGWLGMFLYEVNRGVGYLLMTQAPVFYDELFMLRHLFVLARDLWRWSYTPMVLGGVLGLAAVLWGAHRLLRVVATGAEALGRGSAVGGVLLASLGVYGLVAHSPADQRNAVRWMMPAVTDNLVDSVEIWRSIQARVAESPYRAYDELELRERPDVHVILIESYGRVVEEVPMLREPWEAELAALDVALADDGWHTRGGWSRAPITGGRSWLSHASMYLGTHIFYESVYRQLTARHDLPGLAKWMSDQGYLSVLVAPADRARPGVELENPLDFGACIFQKDLHYTGPSLGWGLVPDQYVFGLVQSRYLAHQDQPLFTSWHTTTSHFPWDELPPVVDDWRSLNDREGDFELPDEEVGATARLRLKRYRTRNLKAAPGYAGEPDATGWSGYLEAMRYELAVVAEHLSRIEGDAIVVVMGDHQPPMLNKLAGSYDVPVHVLSRDPGLLEEFEDHGFVEGLRPPEAPSELRHEAFFSLMVRALVRCCSDDPPPEFLPRGSVGGAARIDAPQ